MPQTNSKDHFFARQTNFIVSYGERNADILNTETRPSEKRWVDILGRNLDLCCIVNLFEKDSLEVSVRKSHENKEEKKAPTD